MSNSNKENLVDTTVDYIIEISLNETLYKDLKFEKDYD